MRRVENAGWTLITRRLRAVGAVCFGLVFVTLAARAQAFVYWVEEHPQEPVSYAIGRANLDGTGVNHSFIANISGGLGITVDGSYMYWAEPHSIARATLDGKLVDEGFITHVDTPQEIAVNGSYIYWTNDVGVGMNQNGTIGRADLDGGNPIPNFITGVDHPDGIAVDASHIYWGNSGDGTIGRANLDGSDPNQRFVRDAKCPPVAAGHCPDGLAIGSGNIYWGDGVEDVYFANLDGTGVSTYIGGFNAPDYFAADPAALYISAAGDASIESVNSDASGLGSFDLSTGTNFPNGVAVDAGLPTPTLSTSGQGAKSGGQISDTATVTGGDHPTGTVSFYLSAPDDPDCEAPLLESTVPLVGGSGTATPVAETTPGVYHWIAVYSGDQNNAGVSGSCGDSGESSTVLAPPTLVTDAVASAPPGGQISDTAFVSGTDYPSGNVSFALYGPSDPNCTQAPISTQSLPLIGGEASAEPVTATTPGTYHWIASYEGDPDNGQVSGTCGAQGESSTVSGAGDSLSSEAVSVTLPGEIDDQATLSGASHDAGGTISFSLYGPNDHNCDQMPVFTAEQHVSGDGTYGSGGFTPPTPTSFAIQQYHWVVSYSGDQAPPIDGPNPPISGQCGESGATSTVVRRNSPQIISKATASATVGEPISDIAGIGGGVPANGGTMTFKLYAANPLVLHEGASECSKFVFADSETVSGNVASSKPFTPPTPGLYLWVASYSGDADNNPESGACGALHESSKITEPTTIVYDGPTTGVIGKALTLSARLFSDTNGALAGSDGVPDQPVTISLGAASCTATTDSSGTASCQITPQNLRPGDHDPITVSFAGSEFPLGSTDSSQSLTLTTPTPPTPQSVTIRTSSAIVTRGRVTIRLACAGPSAAVCHGTLSLSERIRVRLPGGRSKLATITISLRSVLFAIHTGHSGLVMLTLTPRAKKRLAHARGHRLSVSATAADPAARPATTKRTIVLEPPLNAAPKRRH